MFKKLNYLLISEAKKKLILLVLFSVIVSIVETVGVSAIMPFISVSTDFNLIHTNQYYSYIYDSFGVDSEIRFVMYFGMILIGYYIFRSLINMIFLYTLNKFSFDMYTSIANKLFSTYMNLAYKEFIYKNSSTMTKNIINEAGNLNGMITALLNIMSEILIVVFIYSLMLFIDYKITLLLTIFLLINTLFIFKVLSTRIKSAGVVREEAQRGFYEIMNSSFGNFKIIKLQSNETIKEYFRKKVDLFGHANVVSATLNQVPRLFLDALSFTILILIVIYLVWEYTNNISNMLSIISMFILALYRLMPSVNRIMTAYNTILFNYRSLEIIYCELISINNQSLGNDDISFSKKISLNNISFQYEKNNYILSDINLDISRGDKVAFIGPSGSGKSTLVDIIIGLHYSSSGTLKVDNTIVNNNNIKFWRKRIGYIPQSVYLFDGTVGENVSFGGKYDKQKVDDCLKKAQIYNFLKTKKGQDTYVGEGGIMLSGGQKQRIAIARALYLEPDILVLDEATSALDNKTEEKIMKEIYEICKDKTLIIIAHRLSTIKDCDVVYELSDGKIL